MPSLIWLYLNFRHFSYLETAIDRLGTVDYAVRTSPGLDLKIMARTPMALLSQMKECMAQHRRNREEGGGGESLLGYATQRFSDRS